MRDWAIIFATALIILYCASGGCVKPFVNPMIDDPVFPRDYGVWVEWSKKL